jgi:hypothetical protein
MTFNNDDKINNIQDNNNQDNNNDVLNDSNNKAIPDDVDLDVLLSELNNLPRFIIILYFQIRKKESGL